MRTQSRYTTITFSVISSVYRTFILFLWTDSFAFHIRRSTFSRYSAYWIDKNLCNALLAIYAFSRQNTCSYSISISKLCIAATICCSLPLCYVRAFHLQRSSLIDRYKQNVSIPIAFIYAKNIFFLWYYQSFSQICNSHTYIYNVMNVQNYRSNKLR